MPDPELRALLDPPVCEECACGPDPTIFDLCSCSCRCHHGPPLTEAGLVAGIRAMRGLRRFEAVDETGE